MLRTTGESERLLTCRRKTSTVAVVLLAVSSCVNGFAFNTAGLVRPMASSPSSGVRVRHASHIRRVSPGKAAGSLERSISATDGHAPRMAAGSEGEELGFVEKFKIGWATEIPAGDPADLPPCPSGVSDMAKPIQAAIFAAVFAGLGAGTVAILSGLASLEGSLPPGWYSIWEWSWAPFLGVGFALAGVSHFTLLSEFCNIYPGRGAWGFWYLPGTASFHVKWTGVAEFVLGVALALGGLGLGKEVGLQQAAAAGLVALTLAVTPANIYMFSHGAQLPEGLEVPIVGHAVRGLLQCVLLAFFFTLATQ